MEELMTEWRDRKRGLDAASGTGVTNAGGPVTIPLGPGEWDEGLGVPLCIVCQGVRLVTIREIFFVVSPVLTSLSGR
jgi:dynein light intermediate chain 1